MLYTKVNNLVGSAKANPRIIYEKSCHLRLRFLATPRIKAPNLTPIPIPIPPSI
jgi:hypothetical protein